MKNPYDDLSEWERRMGYVIYRGTVPFDELPLPPEDPEVAQRRWVRSDPELRRQYAGLVVAVSGRRVWDAGETEKEAWREARKHPDCPPKRSFMFVLVLRNPPPPEPPLGTTNP